VKFGVITFPGTCDDVDARLACARVSDPTHPTEVVALWHRDRDLQSVDAVVIPGGFSYGDYLRAGAIARFSPAMESVIEFARDGGTVLGICNGFQVLCEAGLLPGALLPNVGLRFLCRQVNLEVVDAGTRFTAGMQEGEVLSIPAKHMSGRYYVPAEQADEVRVVMRYVKDGNPNGSTNDIAGVSNPEGNVFGLMPHPEHAVDELTGSTDGLRIFQSMAGALV
jgi:phosphoribosylformylglycinamidine synthase